MNAETNGLIVYDTTANGFFFYSGSGWHQVGTPRGTIVMWSGTTIPEGWALCNGYWYDPANNGNFVTTNTPLYAHWVRTPDLRGRFIAGYDPDQEDYNNPGNFSEGSSDTGDVGGDTSVTLSTAQMPSHGHTTGTGENHTHTISITADGNHDHELRTTRLTSSATEDGPSLVFTNGTYVDVDAQNYTTSYNRNNIEEDGEHSHTATASTHTGHTHTVNNSGGGNAHENRPPYYALAYIMKL